MGMGKLNPGCSCCWYIEVLTRQNVPSGTAGRWRKFADNTVEQIFAWSSLPSSQNPLNVFYEGGFSGGAVMRWDYGFQDQRIATANASTGVFGSDLYNPAQGI